MVVKKFYAQSTREALRQVREDLGADALILSNRPTLGGGVEIMAVADSDFASMATDLSGSEKSTHPPRQNAHLLTQKNGASYTNPTDSPASRALERAYDQQPSHFDGISDVPINQKNIIFPPVQRESEMDHVSSQHDSKHLHHEAESSYQDVLQAVQLMGKEINQLKEIIDRQNDRYSQSMQMIENQQQNQGQYTQEIEKLKEFIQEQQQKHFHEFQMNFIEQSYHQGDVLGIKYPEVMHTLVPAGFSPLLLKKVIQKIPSQYQGKLALQWVKSALIHNLKCPANQHADPILEEGIYAIVGPTGCGKTSMVAKLAARVANKLGPSKVVMISIDVQKIGGHEQLKYHGHAFGIRMIGVQHACELKQYLDEVRDEKQIILIDTPGMSQKDGRVPQQSKMLAEIDSCIKQLLVLPASSSGAILDECVRQFYAKYISATLISKLDEVTNLGSVLDVIIRHRLPLWYMGNGQRVPKDLHVASAPFLVDRSMRNIDHHSVFNPLLISNQKGSHDQQTGDKSTFLVHDHHV